MNEAYKKQVRLLLDVLPEVAKEMCFAMHGGTAINLSTPELLKPGLQDQRTAFDNQFEGMSVLAFSYDDYEQTRLQLIELVNGCLTDEDRAFLLSVNRCEPDWGIYDFQNFPSVKWKLSNLERFRDERMTDYQQQYAELESILSGD